VKNVILENRRYFSPVLLGCSNFGTGDGWGYAICIESLVWKTGDKKLI
jgi:hypothetical protein